MNAPADLWMKPWHARLRTLAAALRPESGDLSSDMAKPSRVQAAAAPAGSWLRRGLLQALPVRPDA